MRPKKQDRENVRSKMLNVRVTPCLFNGVKSYSEEKKLTVTELVEMAILKIIGGAENDDGK
jgi:hypothetical protein